ncbi:multidrug resistance protein NorM [Variibacter gotjawalensis]|uniref:Multidrug-efflux transporter n=1 Tax=Variibacter gotjawalensis TaxID=1333996 RepID=A0A0S3PTD7_9BRAD|nr:MATE family efflux transporter [Variibacter gotjawalensis]NIK49553.1 MATE family multidrug resistance protein [Variibacter gotjawalensis]RZS45564.1 MATE family multidrug resistance protein [Variibacter gotjawalensis]BAT59237.1 multidrug resistance protein NorM [Variibacter gotjawalensis]
MSAISYANDSARSAWTAELKATLWLGAPLVATNLAQIALGTTDLLFIGRLGAESLAAAAIGVNLFFAVLIFGIGVASATAPMMANELGRNRFSVRDLRRTFRQGLWICVFIAIPTWIILWNTEAILLLLGQKPELAAAAQPFVRAIMWSVLPFLVFVVLRSFVAALERPMWALLVTLAAIVFNVVANWVLVFGHLGFPALGLTGSGIATTLSNFFLLGAMCVVVSYHKRFRRYRLFGRWWRPDWPRLAELWRLGLPIGVTMAFEITIFNAAVFMMGRIGVTEAAAHAIAIQIAAATFMVPMGLSQAATVRVGRAYGAKDTEGIARAGWTAFALSLGFMSITCVTMMTMPGILTAAFIDTTNPANLAVATMAASFLFFAGVFQIADGAQVVAAGALRGLRDTRMPMLIAAFGYWVMGLPLCLALGFWSGLGGVGIWIALATSLAVVAVIMVWRWVNRERLGLTQG